MVKDMEIINAQQFNEYMKEDAVLVDFFATWCGPCKMLSPVLESVASTLEGKVKIVKGQQVIAFSGYMPEAQLVAGIEKAL